MPRRAFLASILVFLGLGVSIFVARQGHDPGRSGPSPIRPSSESDASIDEERSEEAVFAGGAGRTPVNPEGSAAAEPGDGPTGPSGFVSAEEQAFELRYRNMSTEELQAAFAALQDVHDRLRDDLFELRRRNRLVHETLMTEAGPPPSPLDAPLASYRRTIIGPKEVRDVEGVATVWWIYLTELDHPELYSLRRELSWIERRLDG